MVFKSKTSVPQAFEPDNVIQVIRGASQVSDVARKFWANLLSGLLACAFLPVAAAWTFAQQTPPNSGASEKKDEFLKDAESKRRQQAYLKYIEAHRLKAEAQRTNSRQLLDEAIRAFRETILLDPSAATPRVDLGEVYFFFLSQRALAETEAQEAVRLDPKNAGGHLLLARLCIYAARTENNLRSLNIDRALAEYEKVVELDPGCAEAWAFLAELYEIKGNVSGQIQALEKWAGASVPADQFFYQSVMSAELTPERAYYQLSQAYLSQNKNREAIDAARRAYELNPEVSDFARNLISILRVAGNSDDEIRLYSRLYKSANSPTLLVGYGSALIRAGRYQDAAERLREYIKLDQSNVSAMGLLALAERRAGQRSLAIETLKAALAREDGDSRTDLMLELAQTYEELGRNDDAIVQYEKAFDNFAAKGALTPANAPLFNEVVNRLSVVLRRTGNQVKLQNLLSRTRRLVDEHNPLVELITIENLRKDGKRREALEMTRGVSRRYADDRSLKFTEALILSELNRSTESVELLQNMIKGRPQDSTDDAAVYQLLSGIFLQHGKLKEAEAAANKAIALNPDDVEGTFRLCAVLEKTGKHELAERELREILRQYPDNATALNNLGYLLLEKSTRYQEGLRLIEQAIAIEPINGNFLDSLGWAHYKLGNAEKAFEFLQKAAAYAIRSTTVHEHLGDVLLALGRNNEARVQWEKALDYSIEDDEIARLKVKLKDSR